MVTVKIGFVVNSKELLDSVQGALSQLPARVVFDVNGVESSAAFLEKLERAQPDLMMLEYNQVEAGLVEDHDASPRRRVVEDRRESLGHRAQQADQRDGEGDRAGREQAAERASP